MNFETNMSLWGMVASASLLVQLILLVLLAASVASWIVIFTKHRRLRRVRSQSSWFEDEFWTGGNLSDIYNQLTEDDADHVGIPAVFQQGFEELRRQRNAGRSNAEEVVASVRRAMRVAVAREMERMETGLAWLATVGSTSPYIGLFGTVWGIMNAFISLGDVKQATLSQVAPGIAEALVATAMGLIAAIPAVVAYNLFANRVDGLESRFQTFMDEMTGIVERGVRPGADRTHQ